MTGESPTSDRRLAIVLSHPIQYYSPWFRWLRQNTSLSFRVFYLSDFGVKAARDPNFQTTFAWDVDLTSGYESEFVPNLAKVPDTHRFSGLRNPALPARLAAWNPAAILLFGYKYHTHLKLILWAKHRRIPLIFRGDSHLLGRPANRRLVRSLLALLYRQFAAFTYVGAANRQYFEILGVPGQKLFFAPHAVDTALFNPARPGVLEAAAKLKANLDLLPGRRVVLFAGKLVPAKQPRELLEAFGRLRPANTSLVFVGDGPEKDALRAAAAQLPAGAVHFLPFANQSEMPAHYLLADLFVLPSRGLYETWGLAINEAMHLGVPCLVSDQVGCQQDLVTDGETGWVFAANQPQALETKLGEALAAFSTEETRIRAAVAERISHYTYAQTSAGLMQALAAAVT
jgi:glycosyltransferase involved in cell wall biosynthesis